jgi:uncharacterized membrane protein
MDIKKIGAMIFFSSIYGFTAGAVYGPVLACYNLIKFPALILITGITCSIAYYVFSKLITQKLSFSDIQLFSINMFYDISLLLFALSPISMFFALTFKKADETGLHEYPLCVGIHVLIIAVCGSTSLVMRARDLISRHNLSKLSGTMIVTAWLSISLFLGAQASWYLRPWFGITAIPEEVPYILGSKPDFRGATNFYDAVLNLFNPPPQKEEKRTYRW